MAKSKITPELIEKYAAKQINRDYIVEKTELSDSRVRAVLLRAGVKLWDLKNIRNNSTEYLNEICQLYKKKKMTRAEICSKYNIPMDKLHAALYWRKIDVWDRMKKKKRKVKNSRYFDWREFKDHIFYTYNK
ncbi:Hypothetical protein IALB_0096 [Ignavibacterium album JCM 16511]|uniref:Uncharacterized protein n=1 Tax=Ignavibacterium album (strain DSM 19864 / JCM 16511 / NBRC 101810 / Mat9-16) TaxID=945713 RepID=I0AFQ3_IGNAJ|nr:MULTISPECIES: hypothetical protein [Ignavibacterium]AFH47810.1 Hypothetical protein IALB_0096 [Ignavibacterium album JCM 16511]BDQ03512.1 MAG: hypothetical protein KatS3mg037_2087 [Ignavibacterium sp.]